VAVFAAPAHALKVNAMPMNTRMNKYCFRFILCWELVDMLLMNHGIGSNPPVLKGLQRRMRQIASQPPFMTPCLYIAW
jgi:hypothetical protein